MNDVLRDAAFRAGVWQVIEQRAKELKDEAKAELQALEVGDAVAGRFGGQVIAKATMTKGRDKFVIDDEELFLAWVKQHHPTEVVESVRPSFIESLKIAAKDLAIPIDRNGVLVDGVVWEQGQPFVSVRREKDAPFIVAQLLSGGRLTLDGIRQLPQSGGEILAEVCRKHRDGDCDVCDEYDDDLWVHPRDLPESEPTDRYTQDKEAGAL